jgi:hypothetical protein
VLPHRIHPGQVHPVTEFSIFGHLYPFSAVSISSHIRRTIA